MLLYCNWVFLGSISRLNRSSRGEQTRQSFKGTSEISYEQFLQTPEDGTRCSEIKSWYDICDVRRDQGRFNIFGEIQWENRRLSQALLGPAKAYLEFILIRNGLNWKRCYILSSG
ncbi:unnamed protein product [Brassica rapa subsp. trilocularis]